MAPLDETSDGTVNDFYFVVQKPFFIGEKGAKAGFLVWQVMNGWWEGIHLLHLHNGNGIVH